MVTGHLSSERLVLTVATVVVVGVLAVATWSLAFVSTGTADQPQVDADVQQRYEAIDGVNATQTTTIAGDRKEAPGSHRYHRTAIRPAGVERIVAVAVRPKPRDRDPHLAQRGRVEPGRTAATPVQ
jgi:spore germination protein YaaH